jgi:hypothetical protein
MLRDCVCSLYCDLLAMRSVLLRVVRAYVGLNRHENLTLHQAAQVGVGWHDTKFTRVVSCQAHCACSPAW